ncbi:MAG: 2-isopropylmalate synthase [bacterium]
MVQVLDATLREGEQTPGVYFDSHIKLAIADLLDEIGINIIEAGHPLVSKDIHFAVKAICEQNLNALVGAHSRSLEEDVDRALEAGVDFLGIFYCVSDDRLAHVYQRELKSAIDQIVRVIVYAKQRNPKLVLRYTPEDAVRSAFQNVVDASVAAVTAGADIISIADTTGYLIPGTERSMYNYVARLKSELADRDAFPKFAVHCHNDRGFALANALDGYRAGAEIIDATVLGIGERAGIVDLAQLLVALSEDFHIPNSWNLHKLPELYELVSLHANIPIPVHFPITGINAFTHCAGVHTHAATKNPAHYQSLAPQVVGRKMDVSLDHMSGISSVTWALDKIEMIYDRELALKVLKQVKAIGQKGRTVKMGELPYLVEWCKNNNCKGQE